MTGRDVRFQGDGAHILDGLPPLRRLPVLVVLDHIARVPAGMTLDDPRFTALLRFLEDEGRWLGISGPYYGSDRPAPWADVVPRIARLAEARPDRLVWALNRPHPGFPMDGKPDPMACLDILLDAVPDEAVRNAILADTPARLYGFPP